MAPLFAIYPKPKICLVDSLLFGEVSELAEGARLEIA